MVLVVGETGSGKTTQVSTSVHQQGWHCCNKYNLCFHSPLSENVKMPFYVVIIFFVYQIPQFLLDDCSRKGIPCRIFCTQPRRLAAIAVAERVSAERGENIGQTVGYQIRLESRLNYIFYIFLYTALVCGIVLYF